MHKLLTSLLAPFAPKTREQHASSDELDEIISRLGRHQEKLERRLSTEPHGAGKRRLKIALQIAQLQRKKALALRTNLTQL